MASSDNFDDTLSLTAPVGGVTVGTMVFDATNRALILPTTTATSGLQYAGKVWGRVKACPVLSTVTVLALQRLSWSTTSNALVAMATGVTANSQAIAVLPAAAGGTTLDVLLTFPAAFAAP